MESCEICGATEDVYHYSTEGKHQLWVCQRGDCSREMQRFEREDAERAYQDELDALNDRHWP